MSLLWWQACRRPTTNVVLPGCLLCLQELSFTRAKEHMAELPESMSRLTALTQLRLHRQAVRSEQQAALLGGLASLAELHLDVIVPPSISRLTALTRLSYACSETSRVADGSASLAAISGCPSLVCLNLMDMTGCHLPAEFTRLQQLTSLKTVADMWVEDSTHRLCGGGPDLPMDVICALPALALLDSDWASLDLDAHKRLLDRGVRVLMMGLSRQDYADAGDSWHENYEEMDHLDEHNAYRQRWLQQTNEIVDETDWWPYG
jgi:hypothetical protein